MIDVVMPEMGESIVEGTLTKWLKKAGEHVERDEPLFEISTDKVDTDISSPSAPLWRKFWSRKADLAIHAIVGVLMKPAEFRMAIRGASAPPAAAAPAPTPAPAPSPSPNRRRFLHRRPLRRRQRPNLLRLQSPAPAPPADRFPADVVAAKSAPAEEAAQPFVAAGP